MNLLEAFEKNITAGKLFTKQDRLLVAVSGGVDSVVLATLCKRAGYNLSVAHCNFNLRGEDSLRDELFVKSFATQLDVPFYSVSFDTNTYAATNKMAIQEAARILRYEWFEKMRAENNFQYILTAHHADDTIETVLMNFFRGTGIKGLTGIPEKTDKIVRPLLFAKRSDLELFLQENRLSYVQDDSNLKNDYTRNFFRNVLLPQIRDVYPKADANVLRNIERLQETEILFKETITALNKKLLQQKGDQYYLPILLLQKTVAIKTVLHEIVKEYNFTAKQVPEIIDLMDSESGKYILSTTHRILHDRKLLIISKKEDTPQKMVVVEGEGTYEFGDNQLVIQKMDKEKIVFDTAEQTIFIDAAHIKFPLLLRPWRQGDYFYPLGMQKKKKLSKFFIDNKLSLAAKEKVWVLEMNKKIVWVVGRRIDDRFKINENSKNILKIQLKLGQG